MVKGWLREDGQAVVNIDVICRAGSSHVVPAIVDTGFNGQVSLSRRAIKELDLSLVHQGTVEVELANGTVIEDDVYSGRIRFDGQELEAEITLTDADDTFIGTGLFTGKVLIINFATSEVIVRTHAP